MTRSTFTLICLLLLAGCEPCFGGTLELTGDLQWTGVATPEDGILWPASLEIDFDTNDYTVANVTLDSSPYAGSWVLNDAIMTAGSSRFFHDADGEVSLELEMSPLSDLSADVLENIINAEFRWAEATYNDPVAPTSWLTLEGKPTVVPEPSGAAIAVFLLLAASAIIRVAA